MSRLRKKEQVSFNGYTDGCVESGGIERLSDEDLQRLNELLPWMCFTADSRGRRFGDTAWNGKRDKPQIIPDPRIIKMDQLFDLSKKSVLEVGCFEGIHTIGISQYANKVYAIDSRIENVVKTIVRSALFGFSPSVSVCDLDRNEDVEALPKVDIMHHVGVLYHLKNPVQHLFDIQKIVSDGILLDTHYAIPEMINSSNIVNDREFKYYQYKEKGREEVFSGMYDHAKWLLLKDIKSILFEIGFENIHVLKDRQERNGPRITLIASRAGIIRSS